MKDLISFLSAMVLMLASPNTHPQTGKLNAPLGEHHFDELPNIHPQTGKRNADGSVTVAVTHPSRPASTWQVALVENGPGRVTVVVKNSETGKIRQRLSVRLDFEFRVNLQPIDLPGPADEAPLTGVALMMWDGGTAGVQAHLLVFDYVANRFKWVKGGDGRRLRIYNPETKSPYLVESTAFGGGYHDITCFVSSKLDQMRLIAAAVWEYPDNWQLKKYLAGRVQRIRYAGDDRPSTEVCAWVGSMAKKQVR